AVPAEPAAELQPVHPAGVAQDDGIRLVGEDRCQPRIAVRGRLDLEELPLHRLPDLLQELEFVVDHLNAAFAHVRSPFTGGSSSNRRPLPQSPPPSRIGLSSPGPWPSPRSGKVPWESRNRSAPAGPAPASPAR